MFANFRQFARNFIVASQDGIADRPDLHAREKRDLMRNSLRWNKM